MPDPPSEYRERYRPQLHYSPRQYWVNDPNGLVFVDGVFHLFYQHNPHGSTPGNLSWGHAVSTDLVHWTERPVALPARDMHVIYSGSAVVDTRNTSGLGDGTRPPLVALYTGHSDVHPERLHLEKRHHEAQFLAYSLDGGLRWRYGGETAVLDLNKPDFRDPKVFWDGARDSWVMVIVHPDERQVEFYASTDLHAWQPLGTFGPAGQVEGVWEVPEFFPLTDREGVERWVLKVDFNPGGPHGGSGAQYWVGDFDGTTFTPLTPSRLLDHGKDFYAALSWSDLPSRRVWLGWMNNWQYAQVLPTAPWRGAFTVPRELALGEDWHLLQQPVPELSRLRQQGRTTTIDLQALTSPASYALRGTHAHELRLDLHLSHDAALQLEFVSAHGVELTVNVTPARIELTRPGHHPDVPGFDGTHVAPRSAPWEAVDFTLLLDTCSVEIFADGGHVTLTDLLLPEAPIETLRLASTAGTPGIRGELFELASIWNSRAAED